jgi:5-methylcytosine-specific restriction endonuclease McrA
MRPPADILVFDSNGDFKYRIPMRRARRLISFGAKWVGEKRLEVKASFQKRKPSAFVSSVDLKPRRPSRGEIIKHDRRINSENREARESRAQGFHTLNQWMARVNFFGWRCRYCNCDLDRSNVTKDHQIPLALGGSQWASNLVPSCKPCNSWKGVRSVRVIG